MKNCSLFSIFRRFRRSGQALNAKAERKHQDCRPEAGIAPLDRRHRLQPGAYRRPRLRHAWSSNGRHRRGLAGRAGSPIISCGTGRRANAIAGDVVMHDTPDGAHWHEPQAGENAGFGNFKRQPLPYDRFMEAEGVPCYRGIGVRKVQNLPLKPWQRLGGRGSFIQLFGTEGKWGCYVVEVPARGALNAEQHLYEEIFYVVEGRGSTEVWHEGDKKRHMFEWQQGSLFSIPLNAMHR